MTVGIRELKAHLSEYVARAAAGEEIVVTDRGRPIARLVPHRAESDVDRGIAEGWIEAPRRRHLQPVERATSERSTNDVLDEDRG
jgi:prevent-host-death family protein